MKTTTRINDIIKEASRLRKIRTQTIVFLKKHAALLDNAPEELSLSSNYTGQSMDKAYYTAFLYNDHDVRVLCAKVRGWLGVRDSVKKLDTGAGKIIYVTSNEFVSVSVYGGDVPENCTLTPTSHSYITYTMTCAEDNNV